MVEINYAHARVFIRHALTHADYNKEAWKKP
ncbi:MAG: hypothetical protein ACLQIB_47940 [Isosphaeraceae bacterium]